MGTKHFTVSSSNVNYS